ncbi:xanthine dehydrogenase 1-like [Trichoplusia ni]|uniref:Xanthine dehydrogenase 1-like n=1 Tax=Trichoplusia ni TaxID=7111 RepID=A0A7E5WNV2_TRINI|nr:xanthine dehydrogenase 1-like [Trichoplusia ni]
MNRVQFKVNGVPYSVGCEVSSDVTLLDYVRDEIGLKGTKYMCREAGCGACVLSVRRGDTPSYSVNSCMMPVVSCHGLEITTIEELGDRKKGYHALQTTLAEDHGSQCGYCSPGLVMSMYR